MPVDIDVCEALILFFQAQCVCFFNIWVFPDVLQQQSDSFSPSSSRIACRLRWCHTDRSHASVPAHQHPVRSALSRTNAQRRSFRCRFPAASQQPLSALTGYHLQLRDVCLSVRGGEKSRVQQTHWKSGRRLKALRALSCYPNLLTWLKDEEVNVNYTLGARAAIAVCATNQWCANALLNCGPGCLLIDGFAFDEMFILMNIPAAWWTFAISGWLCARFLGGRSAAHQKLWYMWASGWWRAPVGQWKGDSARDKERSAVTDPDRQMLEKTGHDEEYWHWEEKRGGAREVPRWFMRWGRIEEMWNREGRRQKVKMRRWKINCRRKQIFLTETLPSSQKQKLLRQHTWWPRRRVHTFKKVLGCDAVSVVVLEAAQTWYPGVV